MVNGGGLPDEIRQGAMGIDMGTFFVDVELGNLAGDRFLTVNALVDTGSTLTVPAGKSVDFFGSGSGTPSGL